MIKYEDLKENIIIPEFEREEEYRIKTDADQAKAKSIDE